MSVELTEQQQKALDAERDNHLRVVDPRTSAAYVLVRAEVFDQIKEQIEAAADKALQKAFRAASLKSLSRWAKENPY